MPIEFGSPQANDVLHADKDQRALIQAEIEKWELRVADGFNRRDFVVVAIAQIQRDNLMNELRELEAQWADEIADVEGMPNYMTREELEGE